MLKHAFHMSKMPGTYVRLGAEVVEGLVTYMS